jgi:hypothetical protein
MLPTFLTAVKERKRTGRVEEEVKDTVAGVLNRLSEVEYTFSVCPPSERGPVTVKE